MTLKRDFMTSFYEDYKGFLYKKAKEVSFDPQEVDDLVQTVWERLIGKEAVLAELSHPQRLQYILTTVVHTNHELGRKKKLNTSSLDDVVLSTDGNIFEIEEKIDLCLLTETFYEAWHYVDSDVRDILERKFFLKQTDDDIANALGIKPASVRMYISRAKRHARKDMIAYKSTLL